MDVWIFITLYVVAWLLSGLWLTRRILIAMERGAAELWGSGSRASRITSGDRGMAAAGGFGLCLLVPVLPVLLIALYDLAVTRTDVFYTPAEVAADRAERDAAELAEYRRLAREFDLPTPKLPQ